MAVILDLICALVLGGIIVTTILNANDNAVENQYVVHGNMLVQEMLLATLPTVEGEFRNMGFGVPEGEQTILIADSTSIRFLTSYNQAANIDTVDYFVGSPSELNATQNEKDCYLHRSVNHGNIVNVGVVTVFKLLYRNQAGQLLPTPVPTDRLTEIRTVEITMEVQNPYALYRKDGNTNDGIGKAVYSTTLWQQTQLASQNLRR